MYMSGGTKFALILRIRYTILVLSVTPNTKQRRSPLFRASISGILPSFQLFIPWHTTPAHATFLLQALVFRAVQVNKHNERIRLALRRLTIEMISQIFLNAMPEGKSASSSISSVENRIYFAQQADVGIWPNYQSNFGKSTLNPHLSLLILHYVFFMLLVSGTRLFCAANNLTRPQVIRYHQSDRFQPATLFTKRNRLSPHRANMLSFVHVNRRVLDRSQLKVRGWLYCGVDELLEEEHRWLEECERFGPASEEGSAVLLAPEWLQGLHKRRDVSKADELVGVRDRGRASTTRRSDTSRQGV